jgi:hypothetical protein
MINNIFELNSIRDTTLWKTLSQMDDETAKLLAANLIDISEESFHRAKLISVHFPEFTLHDSKHLLRVIELSALILGENINLLNPVEIALLILACLTHDQGMVLPEDQVIALKGNKDFILFKDNWYVEHPNKNEIEQILTSPYINEDEKKHLNSQLLDLENALLTDYLRKNHGSKSSEYIRTEYGNDKRIKIFGVNLSPYIANLASSHCIPTDKITSQNNFNFDELIGTCRVNLPYLAIILRLADLLDFDNERTPDVLFRSIHFTNKISINEWNKHRGVIGWHIEPAEILYSMQFSHPVYESTARKFLDYIDYELNECHSLIRTFPAQFEKYKLNLPSKVNRMRISAVDNSYIFHDLEFSISRDEIVKLLMTDKLYSRPSLCIRELLQNSLDALRVRKSLFGCEGIVWDKGTINITHDVDQYGHEIISCEDNGVGMDEHIITNFLCKVGRSYYRSPEYERQRMDFMLKNIDFDPCSQFGIGFMSCFMLGDTIKIETRKDYGYGKDTGKPLIVEINGLGGLVVIREGIESQPIGTKVTIISRKKPIFFDDWIDQVNLIMVIKGFALATEFPILVECKVKEIKESILIPQYIDKPKTMFEHFNISKILTLEQRFNDIDKRLDGYLRESFLLDGNNVPAVRNEEGEWIKKKNGNNEEWDFKLNNSLFESEKVRDRHWVQQATVSIDGILVAGEPGREPYKNEVRYRLGCKYSQIFTNTSCLIDVRGDIKPEITTSRSMPDYSYLNRSPSWSRVQYLVKKGEGRIWEKILAYLQNGLNIETFWKLTSLYNFFVPHIRFCEIWDALSFPFKNSDNTFSWLGLKEIDSLFLDSMDNSILKTKSQTLELTEELNNWQDDNKNRNILWSMFSTLLISSVLDIENNVFVLKPTKYDDLEIPSFFFINESIGIKGCFIGFSHNINKAITAETIYPLANKNHPLSSVYFESKFLKNKSDIQDFASSFILCILNLFSNKDKNISIDKPGRWAKSCAYLYLEVNWSKYSKDLAAPYYVVLKNNTWFEITEDILAHWREAPISD